ncbi:heterogeneous nuclear ribonucleoprotein L-like isoform X1 [Bolinopsis microptera]|uniref:heterogeneous nuclear ribonucleoprotein L-like isoform X1 n=1 Tax=Bolinopsis microptera TaxID=2820187 RepID=UPI00307AB81C
MPYDGRGPDIKRRRFDDDNLRGRRGRGRGRGRPERGHHERPNRRDEPIEQPEPSQGRPKRERALPSRVIQIGQAEELTEDDIRSALEVFGEIRGVVSPSRDIFLVEFSTLERSVFFINHTDNHGFLIRFISPDLNYGPAQDLPSAMATFTAKTNTSGANHVLEVNVLKPMYPITSEVLHTIASPHGRVSRIVIHNRTEEKIESLIEFDSIMSAEACKEAINGADVYAGCCTLDVKFSKAQSLNVFKNDDDTFDYTDVNPAIAASNRKREPQGPSEDNYGDRHDMGRGPGRPRRGDRNMDRSGPGPRGETMGPGGPPAVLMVHGLDSTMNPSRLFNIFCMYGDVNKIKFLMTKKGIAMVEMKNSRGADNVLNHLNRAKVLGSQISISPSKHREVVVYNSAPGILEDGSENVQVFVNSRFLRYSTEKKAAKNRLVDPSKILHFFALPLEVDEDFVLKLLEDKGCPTPTSISMHKSEVCSAGLLEFDSTEEAMDTAAIANHMQGTHKGTRYLMKIAFTGKKSMPVENYEEAKPTAAVKAKDKKEDEVEINLSRNFND